MFLFYFNIKNKNRNKNVKFETIVSLSLILGTLLESVLRDVLLPCCVRGCTHLEVNTAMELNQLSPNNGPHSADSVTIFYFPSTEIGA